MSLRLPDSMPWQIYQAYWQGPTALLRLFEEAFGRHALYGSPDPDQQQRTIEALSEQVGQLKTQNERLKSSSATRARTGCSKTATSQIAWTPASWRSC